MGRLLSNMVYGWLLFLEDACSRCSRGCASCIGSLDCLATVSAHWSLLDVWFLGLLRHRPLLGGTSSGGGTGRHDSLSISRRYFMMGLSDVNLPAVSLGNDSTVREWRPLLSQASLVPQLWGSLAVSACTCVAALKCFALVAWDFRCGRVAEIWKSLLT